MLYVLGGGNDGVTKGGNYIDSTVLLEFHFSAVRTSRILTNLKHIFIAMRLILQGVRVFFFSLW